MGFRYRKSLNFGPFRVNLSRSGLGYSVGGRGFRAGVDSRGRTYTNLGLPDTGVSYRRSRARGRYSAVGRRARGCLPVVCCLIAPAAICAASLLGRTRGWWF